ncbi:OBAP family protein [Micromonospora okii]|uniref:OBAP family protein n=1 Tax=Micromonospora okii TaxID=1182970 RepID=UPI001E55D3B6|nr:OBAP family protein [Micromonospora okii]
MEKRRSPVRPPGESTSLRHRGLGLGAKALQETKPLKGFDVYVVGFHPARDDPSMQMEAHHYCRQVNDDFLQCVLFDGNTDEANLIGVEYIVSERLHDTLPEAERGYWHPHNYEVLGASLIAPGLPEPAERALMAMLMNSYGKTWHTWHTGRLDTGPGDELPLGEAKLMWSFNREGQCDPALEQHRNEAMGVDRADKRRSRSELADRAHPQDGVALLDSAFPGSTPFPGVVDRATGR